MPEADRTFRVGLVGLGSMGRNHARVVLGLPDTQLTAIVDPAVQTGTHLGVPVHASVEALLKERLDYCVIATPTRDHLQVAVLLAEHGIPCLIEKPLALDTVQGQRIADAFQSRGVPAAVGHIERYNAAIRALRERVQAGELGDVFMMHTRRLSPLPERIGDVGVTLDLATHDFDIARHVLDAEYRDLHAFVQSQPGRAHEDAISVLARMTDETVVSHVVNWLSPMKERSIAVTGERGMLVADTVLADLVRYENGVRGETWAELAQFGGVREGDTTRYALKKIEPLRAEHAGFRNYLMGERGVVCTLEEALVTLRVAERVLHASATRRKQQLRPGKLTN